MNPGQKIIFATPSIDRSSTSKNLVRFNIRLIKVLVFIFSVSHLTLRPDLAGFDVSPLFAQQPTQEWVARYLNSSGGELAVDKFGNSYVLGSIPNGGVVGYKMLLLKYNPDGDTLWTRIYATDSTNYIANVALASDSIGNVYAVGYIGHSLGQTDIVTIKYSPSGVLQWANMYAGAGNVSDIPEDLKLDKQNNIYVSGVSGSQALLIKYSPAGDSIRVRLFNTTGYFSDGLSLGFDLLNNVYVGGFTIFNQTNRRYFMVLKYDSSGNFRWEGTYTGTGFESPHMLAVDRFGNSYLTGEGSDGTTNGCLTVKFDSSGVRQWQKAYHRGPGGEYGFANAIDNSGNLFVTGGSSLASSNFDYRTIKYNPNGDTLWVRIYAGSGNDDDEAHSIVLDDSANVYITGSSIGSGTNYDFATIKYNTNGSQQWVMRYDYVGLEDGASAIALDYQNNVIVTGRSNRGGQNYDCTTIKYVQFTGIRQTSSQIPNKFELSQNYPNPFNPTTRIKFSIPKRSLVELRIYDILGRLKELALSQYVNASEYELTLDGSSYSSGVYFYQLMVDGRIIETKKMIVLK